MLEKELARADTRPRTFPEASKAVIPALQAASADCSYSYEGGGKDVRLVGLFVIAKNSEVVRSHDGPIPRNDRRKLAGSSMGEGMICIMDNGHLQNQASLLYYCDRLVSISIAEILHVVGCVPADILVCPAWCCVSSDRIFNATRILSIIDSDET